MDGKFVWTPNKYYDPLKAGSIDGTDTEPHDRAIIRALNANYVPDPKIKGRPECTILIFKISRDTTEEQVKSVFSSYGSIRRCRLIRDIITGASKGYAFVEYERSSSARSAYFNANKSVLNGTQVFVDFECERVLPGWVPRRLGGGFGGKRESGQLRFGCRARPFRKPLVVGALHSNSLERKSPEFHDRTDSVRRRPTGSKSSDVHVRHEDCYEGHRDGHRKSSDLHKRSYSRGGS